MPSRFTDRIIQHLRHASYQPTTAAVIARNMQVSEDDATRFDAAIAALADAERLIIGKRGMIRLPSIGTEVTGRLRVNPRGFGFVRPQGVFLEGDVFIPPDSLRDAITGDTVRVSVIRREVRRGGTSETKVAGRVLEVLERGQEHFVGVLAREHGKWFVHPDGRALSEPVLIRDAEAKNVKPGSKVVIELLHYPDDAYMPEGVITRVLGEAGRPDVETEAVIAAHGLRTEFSRTVVNEARAVGRGFDADAQGPWPDREDLTGQLTFTIDPPDAKDYDDAISITKRGTQWTLGVHIADVGRFVTPGSKLDEEAQLRGNSVYLPRLVIPMLPEVLSNGVCSLQEGVTRFTKSAFITFDEKGQVIKQRLASTVISSRKRLTYLEAQALIDGDETEARKHARAEPGYDQPLLEALGRADTLARILEKRRRRDGMIVLDLPEVELVFDEDGHVVDAVPEDNAYTHKIIEMFMVEANEAVARTFSELDVPLIRRVHPDPVHGNLEELRMYARVANQKLPDTPTRHDLQRVLLATAGTPAARAIHFAVLRTLTQATYSPALIGHYALASEHYAHFTSPIRRYPDLAVHRVIQAYLDLTDNGRKTPKSGRGGERLREKLMQDDRVLDEGQLLELGYHCTDTENEAEAAERELREYLVLTFLHDNHLGDEFDGVVTGVTGQGAFVSIERFLVEGLVKVVDLPQPAGRGDRWSMSDQTGRLVARKSGVSLGIGDLVKVQVVAVDVASRHLDLKFTNMPEVVASSPASSGPARRGGGQRPTAKGPGRGKGKGKGRGRRR